MPASKDKTRWIQGGLAVLIVLILAFLVVSPGVRAETGSRIANQAPTTPLFTGESQ